jgi:hypothetical protein
MTVNPDPRRLSAARTEWGWLTLLFLIALALCALWIWADQQHLQYQWIVVSAVIIGMCMSAWWLVNGRLDGILIDDRNRISLSRLQWVAWFVVLLGGYFAGAVWNVAYMENWDIKGHFPIMQADLWALLGIVSASAVASNMILDRKKSQPAQTGRAPNAAVNTAAPSTPGQPDQVGSIDRNLTPKEASWADLFLGEEVANREVVDISRLQKLFITVLLLLTYIRLLWIGLGHPSSTTGFDMPPVSDPQGGQGFLWLLGISHAAYLASKATPKSAPDSAGIAAARGGQPSSPTPATRPPADEGTDGCDIDFKADPTPDEQLPVASGGVA